MTCLTVTSATVSEAIAGQADLIVSHHPILFREVKKIRADLPSTSFLWRLACSRIAVASPHTAFDNTSGGINDGLCRRLGLWDVAPLRPRPAPASFKVVVFTPESDLEAVLSGAFEAGAGQIGAYAECSFATAGQGTFFGSESTNPAVGEKGRRETVDELRLELVCPGSCLAAVLSAIRARHSYEEPAIDVFPLHSLPSTSGSGRIGRLMDPKPLEEFARFVSMALGGVSVQFAGKLRKPVRSVAVACGAGDDFLADSALRGADVLLTGRSTISPRAGSRVTGYRNRPGRPLRHRTARCGRSRRADCTSLSRPNRLG